jgi:pilus assembly protein CpaE
MRRLTLVTPSIAFEQVARRALGEGSANSVIRYQSDLITTDPLQAAKEIIAETPDLTVIGPSIDVETSLELAAHLESEHPEIGVILVAEPTPDLWQLALRAGVGDILSPHASDEELGTTLERMFETAAKRRHNLADTADGRVASRLITVIAPKGGVGKTTMSTNLAVALAERTATPVALLDLDLTFGDVASGLGLVPEHTMSDLLAVPGGITATALKMCLTRRSDNLFALCAPFTPDAGEDVPEAVVDRVLRLLADEFGHVVVDTPAGLSEATLAAIAASTDLMLMCDLSVSALKALRKVIDTLDQLGLTAAKRHLVLNRADAKVGIDAEQAAALVGLPATLLVPSSNLIATAMNHGIPILEHSPRSPAAKRFRTVAELFLDDVEAPNRGLARWRHR